MPTTAKPANRTLKVLIADDHAGFRNLVRDFLPEPKPLVIHCADGAEAVSRFAQELPDCVLMDIEMNGMDGLTATRAIRQRFPEARIVIVTQHDDADSREAARAAGALAFVAKDDLPGLGELLRKLFTLESGALASPQRRLPKSAVNR